MKNPLTMIPSSLWHLCIAMCCLFFFSCSNHTNKNSYSVGLDPSWYPLQLDGRENTITGFSTELLRQIGAIENVSFTKVSVSWDNLLLSLQKGEYNAILSSMPPYLFNQKLFDFSHVYLYLGPVLVVPIDSMIDSLAMLENKEVAIIGDGNNSFLLENIPGVLIRTYPNIPTTLTALTQHTIDAALIDHLSAIAYCQDLYQGTLKIVTPPLTEEGLRLITLYKKQTGLLKAFDAGLETLQKNTEYDRLLKKWSLYQ